jgi:hypothetical protein
MDSLQAEKVRKCDMKLDQNDDMQFYNLYPQTGIFLQDSSIHCIAVFFPVHYAGRKEGTLMG